MEIGVLELCFKQNSKLDGLRNVEIKLKISIKNVRKNEENTSLLYSC